MLYLIYCLDARVCSLNRVSFGRKLAETAAGMGTHYTTLRCAGSSTATTPSTPRVASATGARQPRGSRAGGTLHSAGPPPGGHRVPDRWGSPFCWSLSGGHACLIAGSLIVRRPAVARGH